MEIHELNTFSGTLGSSDFFATDNGNDTSKVSAEAMFAPLNARIDNIIAGPAPSAEEIVDARRGADGVTYPSLGDAIRDQVSDLKSASITEAEAVAVSASNYASLGLTNLLSFKYNSMYAIHFDITEEMISGLPEYGGYMNLIRYSPLGDNKYCKFVATVAPTSGDKISGEYICFGTSSSTVTPWFKTERTEIYSKDVLYDETIRINNIASFDNVGKYIDTNGVLQNHAEFNTSKMYAVDNRMKEIVVSHSSSISSGYNVAFYSDESFSSTTFISGVTFSDLISTDTTIQIPNNAKYVAFCGRITVSFVAVITYQDLKNVIESLEVKPHKGEKISFLGDSITTFSGFIPVGNNTFYPKNFMPNVNDCWWRKLILETGMELLINNSFSGSTMSGSQASSGLSRSTNLDDGVSLPDHVIVFMGVNDFASNVPVGECGLNQATYSVNNYSDAYYTALSNIRSTYPNAKLYICTVMQYGTSFPIINSNGTNIIEYNDAIQKLSDLFGAGLIDFTKCGITMFNRSTTLGDGLHPNVTGHNLMFKEALKQFVI